MNHLHRNNAAEWVMVIALMPIVWVVRLWKKVFRSRASGEPSGSAAGATEKAAAKDKPRRPVTIEGLPPRTMN